METRTFIKLEMRGAQEEWEYRHWKHEMRKLYVSLIPIFGKLIAKYMM